MPFIDTNLTYSKQFCDMAVGGYMGIGGILFILWKLSILVLGFYVVYRTTQIFIEKYKKKERVCK